MKSRQLPVKRRSVKKGAFRTLFANVARKRHRAATASMPAPSMEGDVPNLGVARALLVILLIHIVAIAGIFIHSRWIDSGKDQPLASKAAEAVPLASASAPAIPEESQLPTVKNGDSVYTVGANDSYAGIAARFGVSEDELRDANDRIPIRPGRYLRIPPKTISAVEPPDAVPPRAVPVADPEAGLPALVETDAARAADAVLIRPAGGRESAAEPARAAKGSYVVKSGDTFWAIAQKHGTTPAVLMKANSITDPKRLKPGMKLVIP